MKNFNDIITFDMNDKNISGLNNELKCMYIINKFKDSNQNIVFVANSLYEANFFYQSLQKYSDDILLFPMDDFLTSEALAISPELKVTRLETLNELLNKNKKIIVTDLMGYLRFLPPKEVYEKSFINITANSSYKIEELVEKLYNLGYIRETIVNKTGEIAVRGFVIDIFPISEKDPIRIEFWGDDVDSIRAFDVNTQLTVKNNIDSIIIKPITELIVNTKESTFGLKQKDIVRFLNPINISNFNTNTTVIFNNYDELEISYRSLVEEIYNYNISNEYDQSIEYMKDFSSIENAEEIKFNIFDDVNKKIKDYEIKDIEPFHWEKEYVNKRLDKYLKSSSMVVLCLSNRYIVNKIIEELDNSNIVFTNENQLFPGKINLIVKSITTGYIYNNNVVISERELFNKKDEMKRYKTNFKIGSKIRDITKLNINDYVVHQVHGIGKYLGIKVLEKNGIKKDYLTIEYKDGDKLYIPVEKIDYITKYSSNEGLVPKLSKLGGSDWTKTKLRVKGKAENIAKDLLKLYAEREKTKGFSFQKDSAEQIEFEHDFPYQPTIDQIRVSEEIKKDMEDSHPMDRLVCGDVGFGKTEVAFRAIFKAIFSSKQVALLCPTTILSQQHFQNALDRFSKYPVNIEILNRFVTPKKLKQVLNDLKEGKIDLLIGTHRILSDDVKFKNLGLLIVDEEQRFGVKHKEKIKEYKNNIDVLTLSATPIPRTLQMSIAGLRSLSILETPPANRYPVQTYVLAANDQIIKDAIYKELSREGQVFILDNDIKDLDDKLNKVKKLVPEARVVIAHGQMSKIDLENIMFKFINHEYDVLLCTTIIETGIDIPNVNTLIIMDADHFGLSQLYQIRGRVGRSDKIAYCYLMYSKNKILNEIAVKRLKVIKEFTELGSGLSIAMRDLSIRGAGNILGSEQSGYIDSVGIELFMKMLNEEIEILKGNKVENDENQLSEPLVEVETNINDNYVKEEELKIEIHRKINQIDSIEHLKETQKELEDRFGQLPESIIIYMYEEWFEKKANELSITQIKQTKNFIEVTLPLELTSVIDGEKLFMSLYTKSKYYRLSLKNKRLIITLDIVKLEKHFIYYLIDLLDLIKECIKKPE